jgi:hypothetical protein
VQNDEHALMFSVGSAVNARHLFIGSDAYC